MVGRQTSMVQLVNGSCGPAVGRAAGAGVTWPAALDSLQLLVDRVVEGALREHEADFHRHNTVATTVATSAASLYWTGDGTITGYAGSMGVELRHLRCLAAVVDTGSFTQAAVQLGVSQATVSRTVASLESQLRSRLIRRSVGCVSLTPAGERVLSRARRMLYEVSQLVQDVGERDSQL